MTSESRLLRIANAGGYWGDDPYALRRQVQGNLPIDVVSIDFLAEITQSKRMPPWKAEAGFGEFHDERRLTESEIKTLSDWRWNA